MSKLIKSLWIKARPVKKRFYKWGTVGLSIFDDRTVLEKICDRIDDLIAEWNKKVPHRERHIWHTYFNISAGEWIGGMSDIKRIEKERGWIAATPSDVKIEADKAYKYKKEKSIKRTKDYLSKSIKEINQGRSFVKEQRDRLRSGNAERLGNIQAMNEG